MRRALILALAAAVLLAGAAPAAAKRPKPPDTPPTLTLTLSCHQESGGEIPAPHLDASSTWSDIGNGRHTLVVIIPPLDPTDPESPEAGHTHQIFRSPSGSDENHMDFWIAEGTTYSGFAHIENRKGSIVVSAAAEVTC